MSKTKVAKPPKFSAGSRVKPRTIKVPTYQGGDVEGADFASPLVPIVVENKCGLVLTLGTKTEDFYPPEVICERRKNGWMIQLNIDSDENTLLYVLDDNRIFIVKSGLVDGQAEDLEFPPKEVDEAKT